MAHLSKAELKEKLAEAYLKVPKESVWSHYKDPLSRYVVEKLVIIESTDDVAVTYPVFGDPTLVFSRPISEWLEYVTVDDVQVPRFYRVD